MSSNRSIDLFHSTARVNIQTLKKKIETGEHYFIPEEIDAIWWDGCEKGSIDSAYDCYDRGDATAIDGYQLYWRGEGQKEEW